MESLQIQYLVQVQFFLSVEVILFIRFFKSCQCQVQVPKGYLQAKPLWIYFAHWFTHPFDSFIQQVLMSTYYLPSPTLSPGI